MFLPSGQTSGGFWQVDSNELRADGHDPEPFSLELREANKMAIKNANGRYLVTEKNGGVRLGDDEPSKATLWEF